MFDIDLRTALGSSISNSNKLKAACFFPLSREKYIFSGKSVLLDKSSFQDHPETVQKVWNSLTKEEKNQYREWNPNEPKTVADELNTFNNPEASEISQHFGVLLVCPHSVERTAFTMPQVVADARLKFESEFKPYKHSRKFVSTFSPESKTWRDEEVNA